MRRLPLGMAVWCVKRRVRASDYRSSSGYANCWTRPWKWSRTRVKALHSGSCFRGDMTAPTTSNRPSLTTSNRPYSLKSIEPKKSAIIRRPHALANDVGALQASGDLGNPPFGCRCTALQQKTRRLIQLEITAPTQEALDAWIKSAALNSLTYVSPKPRSAQLRSPRHRSPLIHCSRENRDSHAP